MPYDRSSINKFVQNQGGSLSNLGATPTYTGKPAYSPNPQFQGNPVTPPVEGFDWANDYISQFGQGSQTQKPQAFTGNWDDYDPGGQYYKPPDPRYTPLRTPQSQPGRPIDMHSPGGPVPYQPNPTPQFQKGAPPSIPGVDSNGRYDPLWDRGPIDSIGLPNPGGPDFSRGPIDPRSEFQANPGRFTPTKSQFTTLGSLGESVADSQARHQGSRQEQYRNAIRNAVMRRRIEMMMRQRGMGNLNRLGVR